MKKASNQTKAHRIKIHYAGHSGDNVDSVSVLASSHDEYTSVRVLFQVRLHCPYHLKTTFYTDEKIVDDPESAVALARQWVRDPTKIEGIGSDVTYETNDCSYGMHITCFSGGTVSPEISGSASSLPGWPKCREDAKKGRLRISLALGQALEEAISTEGEISEELAATLSYYLENAPFKVGHWGPFKRLFKQLETKPEMSALFCIALARVDSGSADGRLRGKSVIEDLSMLAPFFPGPVASPKTIAYLARRGRRFFRRQSKRDPATYCQLAYHFLTAVDRLGQDVDISERLILSDLLFARGAINPRHGRGSVQLPEVNDRYRRRWDRAPRAWNDQIPLVKNLWRSVGSIPEIQIWAFNVLKSQGVEIPRLLIHGLILALLNPHPPIRKFACHQVAESPSTFHTLNKAAAVAFFEFSTNKQFDSVYDALETQVEANVVRQAVVDYVSDHGMPVILRGESVRVHSPRVIKLLGFTLRHAREAMSEQEVLNLALYIGNTDRFRPLGLWNSAFKSFPLKILIELRIQLPQLSSATQSAIDDACCDLVLSGVKNEALVIALIHSPSRALRSLAWNTLTTGETSAVTFEKVWRSLADRAIESSGARRLRECIYERSRIATLLQLQNAADLLSVVSLALADREFRAAKKALQHLSNTEDAAVIASTLDQFTNLHPNWPWHQESTLLTRLTAKMPGVLTLIWEGLGQGQFESLIEHIRGIDSIARAFFDVVNPADLLRINTQQAELLQVVLLAAPTRLARDRSFAIAAATCPAADVSPTAIVLLEARGGIKNIFMQLFESRLPAAMDAAERFVRELPAGHTLTRALIMICDSGVREVGAVGLALLQDRDGDYDSVSLYSALSEHKRADVTSEVARYALEGGQVRGRGIQRFDNRILRTRRYGRKTKELVKQRIGAETELTAVQTSVTRIVGTERIKSLLAMARGLSKRDREWALRELVRLSENGVDVPSLTVSTTS